MKRLLSLILILIPIGCGNGYVECANACKISGLQMKECITSESYSASTCKYADPLKENAK